MLGGKRKFSRLWHITNAAKQGMWLAGVVKTLRCSRVGDELAKAKEAVRGGGESGRETKEARRTCQRRSQKRVPTQKRAAKRDAEGLRYAKRMKKTLQEESRRRAHGKDKPLERASL